MGTLSKIYVKNDNIDNIINEFKTFYSIKRIEFLDTPKWWFYAPKETIIISSEYENWIEIEVQFNYSLYIYDEFLRRLSEKYLTIILLVYYQSTTGEGRVAIFQRGRMNLSIVQNYVREENVDKNILTDNFGLPISLKNKFQIPNLYDECYVFDYDFINYFLEKEGVFSLSKEKKYHYIHIEKIN